MLRLQWVSGVSGMMLLAAAGLAQSEAPREVITNGGLLHTLIATPVTGQPYSAEQVTHSKQTLPDGTTILHNGITRWRGMLKVASG